MKWTQIARKAAEGSPLSPRDVFVVIQRLSAVGYAVVPATARPEIVAAWWRQKNTGDDPSDYAAYKAMIEVAETVT